MNQLITAIQITMSSLEVSELTGKRHDNVMVDTEKLLNEQGKITKGVNYRAPVLDKFI